MSLFKELQQLYRPDRFQLEDFLTEIVAQVLRDSPGLTLEWLRSLGATDLMDAQCRIKTQVRFDKLPGHEIDSRPDIVVCLINNQVEELVFIESKVDSVQGDTQLQRYSEHLTAEKEKKGYKKVALVFITRDYEATSNPEPQDPNFKFQTTRWFTFYDRIKVHLKNNNDGLANQLKQFMEENRMSSCELGLNLLSGNQASGIANLIHSKLPPQAFGIVQLAL